MAYWEILLRRWRELGRDGLTIPYLIGSQRYFPALKETQDIQALIRDIANNTSVDVYVSYCIDINDLILGIRDGAKSKIAGFFLLDADQIQLRLFITKIVDSLGADLEEVSATLKARYQVEIDNGRFSLIDEVRSPFSDHDVAFITNCIPS